MIMAIKTSAATITGKPVEMIPEAALSAGVLGDGAGASEMTLMASFWPRSAQCLLGPTLPQMYHFFPGVARGIVSFPLMSGSLSFEATQSLNSSAFTLITLWLGGVYLNTEKHYKPKNKKISIIKIIDF